MCGIFALFSRNRSYDHKQCEEALEKLKPRGPDNSKIVKTNHSFLGFRRLAINDLTENGDQPMTSGGAHFMCNGEIYNHLDIQREYGLSCKSRSDCEVILSAYTAGVDMGDLTDAINGDFAYLIYDTEVIVARDRIGVRPLFYGYTDDFILVIASEVKAMTMCKTIRHVLPGYIYQFRLIANKWEFTYNKYASDSLVSHPLPDYHLRKLLESAVQLRTESERPIGCLLSGGLDSTVITYLLVKALGSENVRTYSIGMRDSIDLEYARKVADFLHTRHTEVVFTPEEGIAAIPQVIRDLESYDITTVRASVGMWLLGKYISQHSDDKVIFSGELSDELLCGYLYFHHAPSCSEASQESIRLVNNVYRYDALRADRCISSHGLELRVPFADKHVVDYCLTLSGQVKRPRDGVEKRHLREQFAGEIPDNILWRRKDGFSDGVSSMGKPWYTYISEFVEDKVTDIGDCPSKEAAYYKQIYDSLYPNFPKPIDEYWMPKWVDVDKSNPSGRIIKVE
jgi:asparagine synthase (glutamine-hydrolysing)